MTVRIARPFRFGEAPMDRAVRLFHTCSMRLESITDYYREGLQLRVACRCGRVAFLPAGPLVADCAKRGASTRISQLVRRLKCGDCEEPPVDWGPA